MTDMDAPVDMRAAIRQQLETDRLLGVRFVPIARDRAKSRPQSIDQVGSTPLPQSPVSSPSRQRVPTDQKIELLRVLDESQVKTCTRCDLHRTRTQTVFGQGNPDARLVFVGEGPGFEEDKQGLAFVGRAGELLTRMIVAMGTTRDDVFICNVVKCRPPNNRTPSADEIIACHPYLVQQLETIRPEVIVALGAPASKTLLNTAESIGRLRGRFHEYYYSGKTGVGDAVPLMPTYHPAYLLRNPDDKGKTWDDLQMVMRMLGLQRPGS